jgi:hypothetical protein
MLLLLAALASAEEPAPPPPAPPAEAAPAPEATPEAQKPVYTLQSDPTAPIPAPTATRVVFPVRAANLSASEARAAEVFFRRYYAEALGVPIMEEERARAAIGLTDDTGLQAACGVLACDTWVTLDLVRLDRAVFVIAIERDPSGTVLNRIETDAPSLDQLGSTLDRVARALAQRVPLNKIQVYRPPASAASGAPTPTTYSYVGGQPPPASVSPPSTSARTRRPDPTAAGFKFGVHGPLWPDFQIALSHAFTYRRASKSRFFEINAGFTAPLGLSDQRSWGMVFAEVGLFQTFPTQSPVTFYAGGGFGPRVGGYDDIGFGIGLYAAPGVQFGSERSARTFVQLKVGGDAFTGTINPYIVSYMGIEGGVGF